MFFLQIKRKCLSLHCVFHSIRFKVNKGWSTAVLLFLCQKKRMTHWAHPPYTVNHLISMVSLSFLAFLFLFLFFIIIIYFLYHSFIYLFIYFLFIIYYFLFYIFFYFLFVVPNLLLCVFFAFLYSRESKNRSTVFRLEFCRKRSFEAEIAEILQRQSKE